MGTRSLTVVLNGRGEEIITLYRQYDGYPTGHGEELKMFLEDFQICNGIGLQQDTGKWANGMECLAAQIVTHFKKEIGQLYKPTTRDVGEEFIYTIKESAEHDLDVEIEAYGKLVYTGSFKDLVTSEVESKIGE